MSTWPSRALKVPIGVQLMMVVFESGVVRPLLAKPHFNA